MTAPIVYASRKRCFSITEAKSLLCY